MAKGVKKAETELPEQPEQETQSTLKPYELWAVKVDFKKEQDENFNVVDVPVFTKKGTEPLQIAHIEERHAEILNAQSVNSKTRYFLPE